jgi:glutathione S-transferase
VIIRLHDSLSSGNGYKVRLLLAQLGVAFEQIEYDLEKGETRTSRFLEKVNSNGRIPVLETEGGEFLPSRTRSCSNSRTARLYFRRAG